MLDGEEEPGMPPNSTQNLNAKLSPVVTATQTQTGALSFGPPPIQLYSPPVQIVGGPTSYRGGYHLSV
jgi:hypothetical protein